MISKKQISISAGLIIILCLVFGIGLIQNGVFGMIAELLPGPLTIEGQKSISRSVQVLEPGILSDKQMLVIRYDLHGVCLLSGPASAITLMANDERTYSVSLANYGRNCAFGEQAIKIPIKDFAIDQPLENINSLVTKFWYPTSFNLEIKEITAYKSSAEILYYTTRNFYAVIGLISKKNTFVISRISPIISPIPITSPIPTPTLSFDYKAEYWNTTGQFSNPSFPTSAPHFSRNDSTINFLWNFGSPDTSINVDHFMARWQRNASFEAGTYRFTVTSDDGVRVYVDNSLIINKWEDQPSTTYKKNKTMTAGVHPIIIEYYENDGVAVMVFDFQKIVPVTTPTSTPTPTPTPLPTQTPQTTQTTQTPQTTPTPLPTQTTQTTQTPQTPQTTPNPTPTSIQAPAPVASASWSIRSVSSMKETKDNICNQKAISFIDAWISKAVELGVNYIAVETPYDDPACGSSIAYTKTWVDKIHARGLNVWHRHTPLAFEGLYGVSKNNTMDYLSFISNYIKANPTFFSVGDIFTPVAEPQNGGISGVTYCPESICIFPNTAVFNKWLRDAIITSEDAFRSIGLGGQIKIGYYGFDGFVAWGDNNPDWNGILEDATIQAMGNITIDHYPEIVGDTMENDLNELQVKYPTIPIVIGEWGTITGGDIADQVAKSMQAAIRPNIIGFNYWHMGMGGNEALVANDFTNRASFETVKSFFIR